MNKKVLSMLSVVFLLVGILYQYISNPIYVYADGTSLVSYALSWVDNPNIPYVSGGGRGENDTLESLAQSPSTGTDCSGFVRLVYAHFGIGIPDSSSSIYSGAQQIFYDQSMAVPGDVCWWNGHVAIYIGDNKVVHTHTSRAGHNLIHVEDLAYYGAPSAYLRMVDLGSVSGGSVGDLSGSGLPSEVQQAFGSSEETEEAVNAVPSYGTLVTESDLTGMPIKSSLLKEQNRLNLKSKYDLTDEDRENLAYIQECLTAQKIDAQTWYSRLSILLGLMVITYGILVGVAYIFDYNNNFIDVSLLGLLSMGRWRILDKYDSSNYSFNDGSSYRDGGVCYLTPMGVALRVSIILGIGLFLVSGCISEIIYKFLMWYKF